MTRRKSFWPVLCLALLPSPLPAADGTLFYNEVATPASPYVVRRVSADGMNAQVVPISLPSPGYPQVSRDGRRLLVTSSDPGRPFKISTNVYAVDLGTLTAVRVTNFEDEVRLTDGVTLTGELGNFGTFILGNRSIVSSSIHFPIHKATAPDGFRVAFIDLQRFASNGRDTLVPGADDLFEGGIFSGGIRFPVLSVAQGANAIPPELFLFQGGERTGFNQGGDGLDWHPAREEVVGSFRTDIPAVVTQENAFGSSTSNSIAEGTVLAVFSTAPGAGQSLQRGLTTPSGSWYSYVDLVTNFQVAQSEHDYAPAISPDGSLVAYVRHTQVVDTRLALAPQPAKCSLRVINYDGSGDREILRLAAGLWITKLAWAPDGSEIAFDLSRQIVIEGFPAMIGDATRSEIYAIGAGGGTPRKLASAPAAFPTWSPLGSGGGGNRPPELGEASPTVQRGSTLDWTVAAFEPDAGQALLFSLDPGAPAGAAIDPGTGLLRWTPSAALEPGEYIIVVRATDNGQPPESSTVNIRVRVTAEPEPEESLRLTADRIPGGKVRLTATGGAPGSTIRIEVSSDAKAWNVRADLPRTGSAAVSVDDSLDLGPGPPVRLYRASTL